MTSGGIIFINRKSNYLEFFPLIQPLFPLGNDYLINYSEWTIRLPRLS